MNIRTFKKKLRQAIEDSPNSPYGRWIDFIHKFGIHTWFDRKGEWLQKGDQWCLVCLKHRKPWDLILALKLFRIRL